MKPASCFAASLGKRTQMAKVGGGSNLTLVEILGPAELGEQRELEEGTQGQPGRAPAWPSCSVPTFLHPVAPSSLVLSFHPPLPPNWPSFPILPTSCHLPGFLLAHLQLPVSGKGASCAHLSLVGSFTPAFSSSPSSPFGCFLRELPPLPTPRQTLYSTASSVPTQAPWSITFPKTQQLCMLLAYPAVLVLDHRGHVICDNK